MSEEKPTFKVTDRRLFNPDGSPRDIVREDRAPEPIAPVTPQPAPSEATQTTSASPAIDAAPRTSAAATAASATLEPETKSETDPLFIELMMFVAENAAAMLSGHPQFGGEVNLPYAQQFIDMLAALRSKTTGKLSFEEQNTLDTLLSQLRMQYVQQSTPRPAAAPPRAGGGFTGGDITGGR